MGNQGRVIQITFPKCGSQWVRDVLTAPELVVHSQTPLHAARSGVSLGWPEQPPQTFMGPLYGISHKDWIAHRAPGDRAVVVLRDPRDLILSLVNSLCFSHKSTPHISLLRDLLLSMNMRKRILWGIDFVLQNINALSSWAGQKSTDAEYITSYEKLVTRPGDEYARIVHFLGWDVPGPVLAGVVHRLSFSERSGREAGQEDLSSHYRKGIAGDWRRFFDRELGQIFEDVLPGLLCLLGYETTNRWFDDLPEPGGNDGLQANAAPQPALIELQSAMTRLREENGELRKSVAAFQAHVQALESRR